VSTLLYTQYRWFEFVSTWLSVTHMYMTRVGVKRRAVEYVVTRLNTRACTYMQSQTHKHTHEHMYKDKERERECDREIIHTYIYIYVHMRKEISQTKRCRFICKCFVRIYM